MRGVMTRLRSQRRPNGHRHSVDPGCAARSRRSCVNEALRDRALARHRDLQDESPPLRRAERDDGGGALVQLAGGLHEEALDGEVPDHIDIADRALSEK